MKHCSSLDFPPPQSFKNVRNILSLWAEFGLQAVCCLLFLIIYKYLPHFVLQLHRSQ